jgi:hypothetical protein
MNKWKVCSTFLGCILASVLLVGAGQTPVYYGSNGTFATLTGGTIIDSGVVSAPALATNGSGQIIAASTTGSGNIALVSTLPVSGAGSYTAGTSDAVTVTGATGSSHCTFSPTNATAAAITVLAYISSIGSNSVTITHAATVANGGTVDVVCTVN